MTSSKTIVVVKNLSLCLKSDGMERKAIYSTLENVDESTEWDFSEAIDETELHSIHPYPAKMIPALAHKAIVDYSKPGDVVLDPFAGCGTVLLESSLLGRKSIGIDTNPVSILISKAKTNLYSEDDLNQLRIFLDTFDSKIKEVKPMIPDYQSINYWFDPIAVEDLGTIRGSIDSLSGSARDLAMCVFSSIIVRISYQDSDTRYSRKKYDYEPESAIKLYKTKLGAAIETVSKTAPLMSYSSDLFLQDGRKISNIRSNSVSLIVTSPPYLNAYDYHKYHRHRIHWIGYDPVFTRTNEIGQHDQFTKKYATPDQYFEDMTRCFEEWYRVLKDDGRCLIVVGDAIVSGKPVPVADLFTTIMTNIGFSIEKHWIRNLNVNRKSFNAQARIDQEHVLLFKKDGVN